MLVFFCFFFALISGVSTIGTSFTIIGLPISGLLCVVSTVSTCVSGILMLVSKKYNNKSIKVLQIVRQSSLLAAFEELISISLNDGSIIDAKEFHKLQTLYLQVMADVRNVERRMKVQTEKILKKLF